MSSIRYCVTLLLLMVSAVCCDNSTAAAPAQCSLDEQPWSCLLREWAVSDTDSHGHRQGRIMALSPSGYYVTDRVDKPPPPPPHLHPPYSPHHTHHPMHYPPGPNSLNTVQHSSMTGQHSSMNGQHSSMTGQHSSMNGQHSSMTGHHSSMNGQHSSMTGQHSSVSEQHSSIAEPHSPHGPMPYDEWQTSPPPPPDGKIVNRPPNPYKDKFKPSPQYQPPPYQQIPLHPAAAVPLSDRIGEAAPTPAPTKSPQKPQKQVSETDLYLLSAIEKLVYRVDLMEKRLRKVEESLHHIVVGVDASKKPEPCVANFSRVGASCYHISEDPVDWKTANLRCRKLRASLLELDSESERRSLIAAIMADKRIKGIDIWTGGLNPGLLWIWSHSGRPLAANGTKGAPGDNTGLTVVGEGRCLAMVYDPAANNYVYRGQDCALRHRFICEKEEDKAKLSNEIERVARSMKGLSSGVRKARLLLGGEGNDMDDTHLE